MNRPNSPLIYRSCKEYSTSHNLLLGGIQSQAVKTFMASPGGIGNTGGILITTADKIERLAWGLRVSQLLRE